MVKIAARCNKKKILYSAPMLISVALILGISYEFTQSFIPIYFGPESQFRLILECVFWWHAILTLVSIISCTISDPGYLPESFKHPLTSEGYAPMAVLRKYNYRLYQKQKLYDFSVHADDESAPCISFNTADASEGKELTPTKRITEEDTQKMNHDEWRVIQESVREKFPKC